MARSIQYHPLPGPSFFNVLYLGLDFYIFMAGPDQFFFLHSSTQWHFQESKKSNWSAAKRRPDWRYRNRCVSRPIVRLLKSFLAIRILVRQSKFEIFWRFVCLSLVKWRGQFVMAPWLLAPWLLVFQTQGTKANYVCHRMLHFFQGAKRAVIDRAPKLLSS